MSRPIAHNSGMSDVRRSLAVRLVPAAAAGVGAAVLAAWIGWGPMPRLEERVPGQDRPAVPAPEQAPVGPIRGTLTVSGLQPVELPGAWPRFRGEHFDNISRENVPLARTWPPEGPPVLWSVELGEGYAAAAVLRGRVYVLDYDARNQADALRCLSLADGKEIWRYSYPVRIKRYHGMSRTIPAVTERYVVSLGPKCHVTCLDARSGEFRWAIDLVREYGTEVPLWYAGQCPLIDRGRAIIAVGGTDVLMMAVDCRTGRVVWKTPNPDGWAMTHSSVMPMDFAGKRMYVYCGGDGSAGGVVGVSAEDGRVLWKTEQWRLRVNVPSPVILGEGRIFLSAGYNYGSAILQLSEQDGRITPKIAARFSAKQFGSEQHTPIFYQGHLYGVMPRNVGPLAEQLVCMDLGAKHIWTSGRENRFGLGPYLIADGLIFVMNDDGVLTLVEATAAGYRQLARAKVLDGHESWGPMAIAGGRLLVRDLTRMVCLDVRAR